MAEEQFFDYSLASGFEKFIALIEQAFRSWQLTGLENISQKVHTDAEPGRQALVMAQTTIQHKLKFRKESYVLTLHLPCTRLAALEQSTAERRHAALLARQSAPSGAVRAGQERPKLCKSECRESSIGAGATEPHNTPTKPYPLGSHAGTAWVHTPRMRLNPTYEGSASPSSNLNSAQSSCPMRSSSLGSVSKPEEHGESLTPDAESSPCHLSGYEGSSVASPFSNCTAAPEPLPPSGGGIPEDATAGAAPAPGVSNLAPWLTFDSEAYSSPSEGAEAGPLDLEVDAGSLTLQLNKLLSDFHKVRGELSRPSAHRFVDWIFKFQRAEAACA